MAVKNSKKYGQLGRHQRQLEVERALVWAHMEMGKVSAEDYAKVAEIAVPSVVTKERVSEIEAETRHDIMALTKAMAEAAGEAGWCIHLGATSNDIVDTSWFAIERFNYFVAQTTLQFDFSYG